MIKNIPFGVYILRILTVFIVFGITTSIIIPLIVFSFLFVCNNLRYVFYESNKDYVLGELFTTFTAIVSVIILNENLFLLVISLFLNSLTYHKIISYYTLKDKMKSEDYKSCSSETLKMKYAKNLGHINSENSFFNTSLIVLLTVVITSLNLVATRSIDLNFDEIVIRTNLQDVNSSATIDLTSIMPTITNFLTRNVYLSFLFMIIFITFFYYLFKKIETKLYEKQCEIIENEINLRKDI